MLRSGGLELSPTSFELAQTIGARPIILLRQALVDRYCLLDQRGMLTINGHAHERSPVLELSAHEVAQPMT